MKPTRGGAELEVQVWLKLALSCERNAPSREATW
jgi:hypothetical protein